MAKLKTPYYLIDERALLHNMEVIRRVRELSGAKSVLALKCFSTWSVFSLMRRFMDGTTSSGVYEARLGREKFGGEVHAYSVGFTREDVREVRKYADKIIFNSISQLKSFCKEARDLKIGLRVNPGFSYSHFDLANPARRYSRLGVRDKRAVKNAANLISGIMFHFNCENADFTAFSDHLDLIAKHYGAILKQLEWVSFGGGIFFTKKKYPLERFCSKLKAFSTKFGLQVYLEPGEAAITGSAQLVTTVLDVVKNEKSIAIVDASTEAHMLDHLLYQTSPALHSPQPGPHKFIIAGRSCLAGDVFGEYSLKKKLKPGDKVAFADAAGYTMVKKNWFNGMPMPSIVVKRLNGSLDLIRSFGYKQFVEALS